MLLIDIDAHLIRCLVPEGWIGEYLGVIEATEKSLNAVKKACDELRLLLAKYQQVVAGSILLKGQIDGS